MFVKRQAKVMISYYKLVKENGGGFVSLNQLFSMLEKDEDFQIFTQEMFFEIIHLLIKEEIIIVRRCIKEMETHNDFNDPTQSENERERFIGEINRLIEKVENRESIDNKKKLLIQYYDEKLF